jgi:hypothetical protein
MLRIARSLSSAVAVRSSSNSKHHFENVISAPPSEMWSSWSRRELLFISGESRRKLFISSCPPSKFTQATDGIVASGNQVIKKLDYLLLV